MNEKNTDDVHTCCFFHNFPIYCQIEAKTNRENSFKIFTNVYFFITTVFPWEKFMYSRRVGRNVSGYAIIFSQLDYYLDDFHKDFVSINIRNGRNSFKAPLSKQ